jgi:hypothetical protein
VDYRWKWAHLLVTDDTRIPKFTYEHIPTDPRNVGKTRKGRIDQHPRRRNKIQNTLLLVNYVRGVRFIHEATGMSVHILSGTSPRLFQTQTHCFKANHSTDITSACLSLNTAQPPKWNTFSTRAELDGVQILLHAPCLCTKPQFRGTIHSNLCSTQAWGYMWPTLTKVQHRESSVT